MVSIDRNKIGHANNLYYLNALHKMIEESISEKRAGNIQVHFDDYGNICKLIESWVYKKPKK